jgi:hypothetical protein
MDNYLWTFTCEYFTLLHVVLSVHFTLFHVVSFDQSLTAFRLLCQLTHQPVHTRVVAAPSQHVSRGRSPSLHVSDTHCDCRSTRQQDFIS